jgi:hypothetical protein
MLKMSTDTSVPAAYTWPKSFWKKKGDFQSDTHSHKNWYSTLTMKHTSSSTIQEKYTERPQTILCDERLFAFNLMLDNKFLLSDITDI